MNNIIMLSSTYDINVTCHIVWAGRKTQVQPNLGGETPRHFLYRVVMGKFLKGIHKKEF